MDVPLDAAVECLDGRCGRTTRVVLDPRSRSVTHVVVEESRLLHPEHLVPLSLVTDSTLARVRLRHLRGMWALLVGGGGAGFAGFAFVLSTLRRWWIATDAQVLPTFAPAGIASILIGVGLLVMTAAVYVQGRNRLWASNSG